MRGAEARLVLAPFDPYEDLRAFSAGRVEDGAVVSFVGLARGGRSEAIEALVLEHYPGLTERSLAEIAEEGSRRFEISDVLVIHRAGRIAPGEAIVLAAAAAPHRRAALEAVDYLMDRLKTDAAFWKREEGPSGARWIEPSEADRRARRRWD
ncbi:MAG TPA: molybdenum cofactor biosynthesis protein MoaE [Caulobacteraceae bacterium]|jgi:molybdopterin synthase catalytic subunit